ncbi:MAG: diacylglycerol kinase family protein [Patescibacteria group bacterium]
MHVYIYDDYLNKGKYHKVINRIEIRLTDLGLNGKIIRLGDIKNIKGTIQNEIKLGAKTIIAVGNNQTVNKIIGALVDADIYEEFQKKTLLGIIPVGDDNSIAASFGIKSEEKACNILLARRVEKIDLGLANKHYFLNEAAIQSAGSSLAIDDYTMEIDERGEVRIINLLSDKKEKLKFDPRDGLLDVYIRTKKKDLTYFKVKKFKLNNKNYRLVLDGVVELTAPVELSVAKEALGVIVGKERAFE